MDTKFRPMAAAANGDIEAVSLPAICSPKIDGIRAVIRDGVVLSKRLEPIPNKHVQRLFGKDEYNGLDGELYVGTLNAADVFNRTQSAVMSEDGHPPVRMAVFDCFLSPDEPYYRRYQRAVHITRSSASFLMLHSVYVTDRDVIRAFESRCVSRGYEGVMVRSPDGPYKCGRSTLREGYLIKLKRFEDSEAEVIECYEQMANTNTAMQDNTGLTRRSSARDGKVGKGVLGGFVCRDIHTGVTFKCGGGITDADRTEFWRMRHTLPGRVFTYKHFPKGVKNKPRHPVFKGWRDRRDVVTGGDK